VLAVPATVSIEPSPSETLTAERVLPGGATAPVAWYTEDVTVTTVVGLVALWVIRSAVPV
jgi:branched-subunit amino acid transport protein